MTNKSAIRFGCPGSGLIVQVSDRGSNSATSSGVTAGLAVGGDDWRNLLLKSRLQRSMMLMLFLKKNMTLVRLNARMRRRLFGDPAGQGGDERYVLENDLTT
jgi:hypothetical protein